MTRWNLCIRWLGVWAVSLASAAALAQDDLPAPVYIEDSPAAQELVEQARVLRQQGRLTDAAARFQQVMEAYGRKLMPIDQGLYLEASRWVQHELRTDDELLEVYRQAYGPVAERARLAALEPQASAAAMEAVLRTYHLTPAGLRAGLDLVALYLERADLRGAVSVLDDLADHPDLQDGAFALRYHALAATAALLTGDEDRLARQRARLEEIGGDEASASIDALAHRVHPPLRLKPGNDGPDGLHAVNLAWLDEPLWEARFEEREVSRRSPYGGGQPASTLPVEPVADGDWLYINESDRVYTLDRYSGRRIWTYGGDERQSDELTPMMARMGRSFSDRRGVLLSGDRVFAVVGPATLWSARVQEAPQAALTSLDRRSGELRWRVEPGDLDPSLDKAYFQGTPIAAYGRVFALIRRHQAAGFQDALVVAVEASTGNLLWRRHISSAVTASRYAATPTPQMTLVGGTLYVTDNLAAVAAITARSGSLQWERVFSDDDGVPRRGLGVPRGEAQTDVAPPVLVEAGLVVPPSNITSNVVVLDPASGRTVRTLGAADSTAVDYLLPAGRDVLAVGRRVSLLDGQTLSTRWSVDRGGVDPDAPRGAAAVTEKYIIIPAGDRLTVLDRTDGSPVRDAAIQGGGNVAVIDGQLVVADAGGVKSFMPWGRAYDALVAQIERSPSDPAPGLALTHLALSHGRDEAALQGADAAVAATESLLRGGSGEAQQTQQRVFDQLMRFTEPAAGAPLTLREALFDRLAAMTTSPGQEVAYHLSVGRLYEDMERWAEAVDHYQAVLLNETLASQLYRQHDVLRQAGLEARRRLTQLVEMQGPAVYQRFHLIAAQHLAALRADGPDPQRLIELATRYPLSDAAPLALLEAGLALIDAGHVSEAITQLRRAYVRTADPAVLAELAGRLAEAYERVGRPRQAMQWLRRVSREHPGLEPIRAGSPARIDPWLRELAALPMARGVGPSLTLPLGRPYLIRGELLLPTRQPADDVPGNRVFTREGQVLRMYSGTPLEPTWEAALLAPDAELLAVGDEQILLWSEQAGELASLDATTGEATWPSVKPSDLLEPLGDRAERRAARPAEQREFMQMIDVNAPIVVRGGQIIVQRPETEEGFLTVVAGGVICIADRFGGIVGIDRHSGRMLWQTAAPLEQVSRLSATADALAVAGVSGAGTDAMSGAVQVFDPLTGEPRLPVLEDKEPPQWVGFVSSPGSAAEDAGSGPASGGLMIVATIDQVTAHRLDDGEVVWRMSVPGPPLTGQGWTSAELILLATNGDGLLIIDPATGELRGRMRQSPAAGHAGVEPVLVDDQWQLLSAARATALRPDGQVHWRDARSTAADDGEQLVQQLVGERYVVLAAQTEGQPQRGVRVIRGGNHIVIENGNPAEAAAQLGEDGELLFEPADVSARFYILDRSTGSLVAEYRLAGLPATSDPAAAQLIDNHILFAAGAQTVVVPGAASAAP